MSNEEFTDKVEQLYNKEAICYCWIVFASTAPNQGYEMHVVVEDLEGAVIMRKTALVNKTKTEESLAEWRDILFKDIQESKERLEDGN